MIPTLRLLEVLRKARSVHQAARFAGMSRQSLTARCARPMAPPDLRAAFAECAARGRIRIGRAA